EQLEVELHLLDDPGPANLHDHVAAGSEERPVDLPDRRARERLLLDRREPFEADLALDHVADLRERHRRHVVDELLELGDVDVRQQVRSGREELPELDERRPEGLEGLAEATRGLPRRRGAPDDADFPQHAHEVAAPGGAGHLEGTRDLALAGHSSRLPPSPGPETVSAAPSLDRVTGPTG